MVGTLIYMEFQSDFVFIFTIFWIIYTIPVIYLHSEYYLNNRGEIYKIDSNGITLWKSGAKQKYRSKELDRIILYKSANMDAWGFPLLAMEFYYYARVINNSGEELIITRLLTPEVEKEVQKLEGVPVERVKRAFCAVFWK